MNELRQRPATTTRARITCHPCPGPIAQSPLPRWTARIPRTRRISVLSRVLVAMATTVLGSTAWALDKIAIQQFQGTFGNATAVVAASTGICKRHGLDCEIKFLNSGPIGVQALIGRSIDVAFAPVEVLAAAVSRGANLRIVYSGYQALTLSLVGRNDLGVTAADSPAAIFAQLKGKRIGVTARGSQTENHFLSLAAAAGLSAADFTMVPVGGPQTAYTALVVGRQVDAMLLMNPMKQICFVAKTCQLLLDANTMAWPGELKSMVGANVAMAMRSETVDKQPALVARFIQAMTEANAWIRDPANRAALREQLAPTMGLGELPEPDRIREAWIEDDIVHMGDGRTDRKGVEGVVDFLSARDIIKRRPAVSELVFDGAP